MLFAALIGPYFINWTSYRQDFEREASRILGQKVEVLGSAEARLLPFPSVTFNDVRVENAKTGAEMMTIAHFSMDAELAPFLRGQILIYDMRIVRPKATVRLGPDGSLNWARRKGSDINTASVVLENVAVEDGTIDVVDDQNGRTQEIRNLQAEVSADTLAGPWKIEGTGSLDGESGAFSFDTGAVKPDGSMSLRASLLPDDEPVSIDTDGDVRFDGSRPRYNGQFTLQVLDLAAISGQPEDAAAKSNKHPAVARATGNFALDNASLRVDQYRLEVGPNDDPYVVTGKAMVDTGRKPGFTLTADGQQIDIDQLDNGPTALNGSSRKKSRTPPRLTPAERLTILHRIAELIPIPPMPGKVSISLPAVVAGDTTVRSVSIKAEPAGDSWTIDQFVGQFPGRTQIEAKGKLLLGRQFGFAGHLLVAAKQPSGLAEWLTGHVDTPIRLLTGAGFSADVRLTARTQRFEKLELAVGPSTIRGGFERTVPETGRPTVAMNLNGDDIDLGAVEALAGLFTGERNGLSLAGQDVTARLKADRFQAYGAEARNVDAVVSYRAGALKVSRLKIGDLAGAALSMSGNVEDLESSPAGHLEATVDAADPTQLLTFAQVLVGANPVLSRLARSAAAFDGSHLKLTADAGKNGLKLDVTGKAGGSDVTIAATRADLSGELGSKPMTVELTLANGSVNKLLSQIGFEPLPIEAPGPGLLSLRLDGTPDTGAQLALDLSGGDTSFSANGTVALANDTAKTGKLALRLKSDDLTPYLIMNGIGLPDSAGGLPADLRASIAIDAGKMALTKIAGSAAGNSVSGDLTLTRGDDPSLSGNLSLGEIDAAWLTRLVLGPGAIDDGNGNWSDSDFAPPQDLGVDVDVAVNAEKGFLGYGAPARDMRGEVTLKSGTLNVGNVSADWLGGKLTGNLRLANSSGSGLLMAQMALKNADLGKALATDGTPPAPTGRLQFSASAQGSGKSAHALVGALTGSGSVTVGDLVVNGIRSGGFGDVLKGADATDFKISEASARKLAENAIAGGTFALGDVSFPFTLTSGTLHASNITAGDRQATVSGGFTLDLVKETVDGNFVMAFDPGKDGYAGATPSIALDYGGPVAAPSRRVDAGELSNYLSLRAYEIQRRKVELLQAAVLQKQRLRRWMDMLRADDDRRSHDKAILLEEQRRRAEAKQVLEEQKEKAAERQRAAAKAAAAVKAAADATAENPTPKDADGSTDAEGDHSSQPPAGTHLNFDVGPLSAPSTIQ